MMNESFVASASSCLFCKPVGWLDMQRQAAAAQARINAGAQNAAPRPRRSAPLDMERLALHIAAATPRPRRRRWWRFWS